MNPRMRSIAVLVILFFSSLAFSQTTWTGAFSSNWGQANNWSNGLPGPFNEPVIPANPTGPFTPTVTIFTYFNFNVHNHGAIKVDGSGGVTLFGTFINYPSSTLILGTNAANFLIETTGSLENHGTVLNNGTFNNRGLLYNALGGIFGNHHIFSHTMGSFNNQGEFNNLGQFFSEDNFLNAGVFNNHHLLNNNGSATNIGVINSATGATLRNDLQFQNQVGGICNVHDSLLNNHTFLNYGQVLTTPTAVANNSFLIRNLPGATWNNQGTLNNVFCAIFEAKGTQSNQGLLENEGIVYADTPIAPNQPSNLGSGVVITANNAGILCHDFTVPLGPNNSATVVGIDLANDQFNFCTGWNLLVNGSPSVTFNGCASLGLHNVSVSFTDPFGRTTLCPAQVLVIDNLPPVIACQPNQNIVLPASQCSANANLLAPTIVQESCAIANINNDAPASFPIGPTVVNWTVSDQNGNTATCAMTINVADQSPPTINCPPDKTLPCLTNACGLPSQVAAIAGDPATASDNCGVPTVGNNALAMLPVGANLVTWSATDAYGNIATCTQAITIIDNQAPTITACTPDLTVQAEWPGCSSVATWGNALAIDNCGTVTQHFSIPQGSTFDLGSTPVTVTVTDAHQNTASCQFNVVVVDVVPPIFVDCPNDQTIHLTDCNDMALADWLPPTVVDACLGQVVSNVSLGDLLAFGTNPITYTATDLGGNSSTCSFTVTVDADLALDCPADMVVNIGPGETFSALNWNPPAGISNCPGCTSFNMPDFYYLGEKSGHRYFVYTGGQVTWAMANDLAAQAGGHLLAIGDLSENELLRKELPPAFQSVWMGLNDAVTEGQFVWSNNELPAYSNWQSGSAPQNAMLDYAVFTKDGTWYDVEGSQLHSFLLEIPCYEIMVSSSNPNALANATYPIGTTTINYEVTDKCGHACTCGFDVNIVQNQQVMPCLASGNADFGWIEAVQTEGFDKVSGNNGGRGDFSGAVLKMPDPGCVLKLKPGGPAVSNYLYWRIWADLNQDGDYFDDDELLGQLEGVGEQAFCYDVDANLPTGAIGLRIAMSRWDYASACGTFLAGEVEDYTVNFVDTSTFSPDSCQWVFEDFGAMVEGWKVELAWQGMGNCPVAYFEVQRLDAGNQFKGIAELAPSLPMSQTFEYADKLPQYGTNLYRIKAELSDGTEVFSSPVQVVFDTEVGAAFAYPNPVKDELILHVEPLPGVPARIFIADSKGQLLQDQVFDALGNEPLRFDLHDFSPGIYTLYLKPNGHKEQVVRFVVGY